jgi:hypothetical protein
MQQKIFVASLPKYDWNKIAEEKKKEQDDPCGGRDCDTCEIGGCDHGIESELNPELRARMEQNSKVNYESTI